MDGYILIRYIILENARELRSFLSKSLSQLTESRALLIFIESAFL